MKVIVGLAAVGLILATVFVFLPGGQEVIVRSPQIAIEEVEINSSTTITPPMAEAAVVSKKDEDIEPQPRLANPPSEIRAIYITGWSAGLPSRIENIKRLAKSGLINAVVIDVKDYSGYLSYKTDIELAEEIGAHDEVRFHNPNKLIKELHDVGLYLIARISVFQDPKLAFGKPELALSTINGSIWKDNKGLAWLDPAAQPVWDYVISIGEDARDRGFDELNYDYIRFPSDGNLKSIIFPFWNGVAPREEIMRNFYSYLRNSLKDTKLSADLFGLVTVREDDLGIGQVLEGVAPYFDAIAPMVYPSHYGTGFLGFNNPAEHPYEVIDNALEISLRRLLKLRQSSSSISSQNNSAVIRPWLQDFDLGADYDEAKVRAQIEAVEKWQKRYPGAVDGWMLWNASNVYTEKALVKKRVINDPVLTTE